MQNAIRSHAGFATKNIEVFAQGSYRNGTNVRMDSDVPELLQLATERLESAIRGAAKTDDDTDTPLLDRTEEEEPSDA